MVKLAEATTTPELASLTTTAPDVEDVIVKVVEPGIVPDAVATNWFALEHDVYGPEPCSKQ